MVGLKSYRLDQLIRDGRGGISQMPFDTYSTLAQAKRAAKKELAGKRWAIIESTVVAMSEGE